MICSKTEVRWEVNEFGQYLQKCLEAKPDSPLTSRSTQAITDNREDNRGERPG